MSCQKDLAIADRGTRRVGAFTLAEMLVVMGIIAVLLAVMLPAVRGLNNSASRQGAVGTLLGTLDRARAMAVSDGLATYVVFAVPNDTGGKQFKQELWGRAYAIYQDHDNILFAPEQRTPWVQLPQGMAFKINDGGGQFSAVTTNTTLDTTLDPSFPVAAGALSTVGSTGSVRLPYWKFDSYGAVDARTLSKPLLLRLLIFPGVIDANSNEVATQNTGGTAGNRNVPLLEEIDLNSATGRAKYIVNPTNNLAAPTPTPST